MGAWGTAIISDDTVSDVVGTVVDRLKAGDRMPAACAFALREFSGSLSDPDDGPLVWLALAHVQWKYGRVDPIILKHIRDDIDSGRGLGLWQKDPKSLKRRVQVLRSFVERVSTVNPKPSARPRAIVRLAPYAEGDCIAVLTQNGLYTAAIVVAVDNSRAEYGKNLVGSVDYLSSTQPTLADFERRQWLFKRHGNWKGEQELSWYGSVGLRAKRKYLKIVGRTAIRPSDPKQSNSYANWRNLGTQILLCRGVASEA